ncbi:MAG: hypothetical protein CML13_12600 [Puniceicoccaceae bacterium]|nr:hypothetical protein [Puniceicoccaceae bacterium]|tara:strand:- start:113 stop:526 length:414 start_codon:yes stop_codon:yes gene_type:complete
MKKLLLLFILAVTSLPAFGDGVSEVIEKEGILKFSDGSSIYTFHKDGSFDLNPCGMSGRTIRGNWKEVDRFIQVEGEWSWVNGLSVPGDIRIMELHINTHPSFGKETAGMNDQSVSKVYFTIESIYKKKDLTNRGDQ